MDGRRWETGSFAGEEAGQEVLDLWVDAEGVGDAALPGDPELPAEGLGVVKEDEAGLPTLAVGLFRNLKHPESLEEPFNSVLAEKAAVK